MQEEKTVSKEELVEMFNNEELIDSGKAWICGDYEVDIIALHEVDPKFLQDITNAKFYKLVYKERKR